MKENCYRKTANVIGKKSIANLSSRFVLSFKLKATEQDEFLTGKFFFLHLYFLMKSNNGPFYVQTNDISSLGEKTGFFLA